MKKTKFTALFLVLLASLSITSCSSDDSSSPDKGKSTGDYWPMAKNNLWSYDVDGTTYNLSIPGVDVFGGTSYYQLNNDPASSQYDIQTWVAKKGATYYNKVGNLNYTQNGVAMTMAGYEVPVFKDNLPVNGTWNGSVSSNVTYNYAGQSGSFTADIKYNGIILEKDSNVTVNDTPYNDVIKASLTLETTMNGQTTTATSIYWFAKNIGPVKIIETSGSTTIERNLKDYSVN